MDIKLCVLCTFVKQIGAKQANLPFCGQNLITFIFFVSVLSMTKHCPYHSGIKTLLDINRYHQRGLGAKGGHLFFKNEWR